MKTAMTKKMRMTIIVCFLIGLLGSLVGWGGKRIGIFIRANHQIAVSASHGSSRAIYLYSWGRFTSLTSPNELSTYDVEWSPDGRSIAFIFTYPDNRIEAYIGVIDIETNEFKILTEFNNGDGYLWFADDISLTWSPDGEQILYSYLPSPGTFAINLLDVLTGISTQTQIGFSRSTGSQCKSVTLDWSPGPFPLVTSCWVHRGENTSCEIDKITTDLMGKEFLLDGEQAQWLPTGEAFSFTRENELEYPPQDIYVVNQDLSGLRLVRNASPYGVWSPNGSYMLIQEGTGDSGYPATLYILDWASNKQYRLFASKEKPYWTFFDIDWALH